MDPSNQYPSPTWRDFFAPFRNPKKFEELKEELKEKGYKISFLGGSFSKAHWDEQVRKYSLDVRSEELPITTFAMVLSDPKGRVIDFRELLPTPAFASKDVKVSEKSIFVETGNSTEYSILTISAKYEIGIIRASNLYLGEETPHCVHLPSELWQLMANSKTDIEDFGSNLPVRTSTMSKSAEHVGKKLIPELFNPIYLVSEIDLEYFSFGIHFKPPLNRPAGPARIFYAEK